MIVEKGKNVSGISVNEFGFKMSHIKYCISWNRVDALGN